MSEDALTKYLEMSGINLREYKHVKEKAEAKKMEEGKDEAENTEEC